MGRKKKVMIIAAAAAVLIIAIAAAVCIYNYISFNYWEGDYESVDGNSAYTLELTAFGGMKIVDIGAGNPVAKGHLFRIPFKENECLMSCLSDPEFDAGFIGLGSRFRKIGCWLSGIYDSDENPVRIVIFENGKESIQFNEAAPQEQ